MDEGSTWHGGRPQPRRLCLRWGPAPPPKKGGRAPKFSAHVHCGQTAGWIKMVLGMEVGLSPGDSVWDGDPAFLPKKGAEPPLQFWAHFYCGQTAGCIKMPRGMEVDLSQGDFVLDGDPALSPQRGRILHPNCRPMFIIVIVISLEHCTVVIGLFKFNF